MSFLNLIKDIFLFVFFYFIQGGRQDWKGGGGQVESQTFLPRYYFLWKGRSLPTPLPPFLCRLFFISWISRVCIPIIIIFYFHWTWIFMIRLIFPSHLPDSFLLNPEGIFCYTNFHSISVQIWNICIEVHWKLLWQDCTGQRAVSVGRQAWGYILDRHPQWILELHI